MDRVFGDFRGLKLAILWVALMAWNAEAAPAPTPARFGVSPDNGRAFLLGSLRRAEREVLINIYEFKETAIRDAVIALIRRGVTVRILIEGEPVGRLSRPGKQILEDLRAALQRERNPRNRLFAMAKTHTESKRRYSYNHAKYAVIDGRWVFVSSENFSPGAHGPRGRIGNRGWHVEIDQPALAARMSTIFKEDTSLTHGDVVDLMQEEPIPVGNPASDSEVPALRRTAPPLVIGAGTVGSAELITSPGAEPGLTRILRSARRSAELQFMSLPPQWKTDADERFRSPIVSELLAAASRGTEVRVLLNDEDSFGPRDPAKDKNLQTLCMLNSIAREKGWNIAGRIIDVDVAGLTYIHNKGVIADGARALISSINGTRNSVEKNRETALLLESKDAARYYGKAFDFDWSGSKDPSDRDCRDATNGLKDFEPGSGSLSRLLGMEFR